MAHYIGPEIESRDKRIEELEQSEAAHKDALRRALKFVDEAFQPDFMRLGGNKFAAVPQLARDYVALQQQLASVTAERDKLRQFINDLDGRKV